METGDISSLSASLFALVFFCALVTLLLGRQLQGQLAVGQRLELPTLSARGMLLLVALLLLMMFVPMLTFLVALVPAGVLGRVIACDWPGAVLGRAVGFVLLNGLSLALFCLYELSQLIAPPAAVPSPRVDLLLVEVLLWPSLQRLYGLHQLAGQQADQPGT